MSGRAAVVVLSVILVAGLGAADTQTLVLVGGATLEVSTASREGGLVYVSFPDGQMRAYPADEVDLVASGLAPAPVAPQPTRGPRSLADAVSKAGTPSAVKITDQDVDHVKPELVAEGEGEGASGEESAAPAALLIAGLEKDVRDGMVNLSGTVVNSGGKAVNAVTLEARALDGDGQVVGRGSTNIPNELAPKAEMGFTLSFPIERPAVEIAVRAIAAMAAFDFTEQPAPAAADTEAVQ